MRIKRIESEWRVHALFHLSLFHPLHLAIHLLRTLDLLFVFKKSVPFLQQILATSNRPDITVIVDWALKTNHLSITSEVYNNDNKKRTQRGGVTVLVITILKTRRI